MTRVNMSLKEYRQGLERLWGTYASRDVFYLEHAPDGMCVCVTTFVESSRCGGAKLPELQRCSYCADCLEISRCMKGWYYAGPYTLDEAFDRYVTAKEVWGWALG